MLVKYQEVSFSEHLHHMSILALDMANAVDFLVSYYQIGANLPLSIVALICVHTALYNPITLLYCSIIFRPNLL